MPDERRRRPIIDFLDLARARRSVRSYRPDAVPAALLEEVLEAARWAPSAVNTQPWEFIIVTDEATKAAIGRHARYWGLGWPHIRTAPALIVVCGRRLTAFSRDDCIFAGANLMLAAADRGLGTCWIGGFNEQTIKELLAVPTDHLVPGLCTIGYPVAETAAPPRRPLAEMVHHDTYAQRGLGLVRLRGPWEVVRRLLKLQLQRPRGPGDDGGRPRQ